MSVPNCQINMFPRPLVVPRFRRIALRGSSAVMIRVMFSWDQLFYFHLLKQVWKRKNEKKTKMMKSWSQCNESAPRHSHECRLWHPSARLAHSSSGSLRFHPLEAKALKYDRSLQNAIHINSWFTSRNWKLDGIWMLENTSGKLNSPNDHVNHVIRPDRPAPYQHIPESACELQSHSCKLRRCFDFQGLCLVLQFPNTFGKLSEKQSHYLRRAVGQTTFNVFINLDSKSGNDHRVQVCALLTCVLNQNSVTSRFCNHWLLVRMPPTAAADRPLMLEPGCYQVLPGALADHHS